MATKKKHKPAKVGIKPKQRAHSSRKVPKKPKAATKPIPKRSQPQRARSKDTREDPAHAAAELITLERRFLAGSGDAALFDRWVGLVNLVLGSADGPHSRRSVRLPASVPVRLGIRKGEFTCQLTDLSQLGLTVSGPVLSHITVGEPIELRSIERSGGQLPVGVLCDIVRIDNGKTPAVAGLRLARDNDPTSQRRFFDAIYYPLYLAYLERRAESA